MVVYVTYKNMGEANKIVKHLIKKRIISCANLFPVKSLFSWKGKVEESDEIVSVIKTKKENWETLKSEIKSMHSYEVPCIINLNAESDEEFESWMNQETSLENNK